ncbi:hypothetical protein ACFE04_005869 [Oxalis oulophora]
MGRNRRFAQVANSDDEDDSPPLPPPSKQLKTGSVSKRDADSSPPARTDHKKRKQLVTREDDSDNDEDNMKLTRGRNRKRKYAIEEEEDDDEEEEEEETVQEDAKPIGDSIRVSGKGRGRRSHYEGFEFDGNQYTLEDPVLLVPEDKEQKPYVAIIKLEVTIVCMQKTISRLGGELPDLETGDIAFDHEEQAKKKTFKKRNMTLDVTRDEEVLAKSDQKPETPGSCLATASEYHEILTAFDVLTGDSHRDKWLERLLQAVRYACSSPGEIVKEEEKISNEAGDKEKDNKGAVEKLVKSGGDSFLWPNSAVAPVTALEQASHETLSSDFQKYNQKMRQLLFNLKNNEVLARRLLNGELQPSKVLSMSPNELKEGLTAEETTPKDTVETEQMQMTETRCSRCNELKVGVRDIILSGKGDRYQLECTGCGNSWYASRDEVSTVTTTDVPNSTRSVGSASLATAKFETVEKLLSPRESDKSANAIVKKSTEAYMPVIETQKYFVKSKNDDNTDASTKKAP